MSGKTTNATLHGEVKSRFQADSDAEVEGHIDPKETQSERLQPSLTPEGPRTYEVTYFWDTIVSYDLGLSHALLGVGKSRISSRPMVHVVKAYDIVAKTCSHILSESNQKEFIAWFYRSMDDHEILTADELPGVSFKGSTIMVSCRNVETLQRSYEVLRDPTQVKSFCMVIEARGLPFRPRQWALSGLPSESSEETLVDNIKAYLSRSEWQLGQYHQVMAKFYTVSGVRSRRFFAGNLLILTDADTIIDGHSFRPIEEFCGVTPEVCTVMRVA